MLDAGLLSTALAGERVGDSGFDVRVVQAGEYLGLSLEASESVRIRRKRLHTRVPKRLFTPTQFD